MGLSSPERLGRHRPSLEWSQHPKLVGIDESFDCEGKGKSRPDLKALVVVDVDEALRNLFVAFFSRSHVVLKLMIADDPRFQWR